MSYFRRERALGGPRDAADVRHHEPVDRPRSRDRRGQPRGRRCRQFRRLRRQTTQGPT